MVIFTNEHAFWEGGSGTIQPTRGTLWVIICVLSFLSFSAFITGLEFGADQQYPLSYTAAHSPSLELVLVTECH